MRLFAQTLAREVKKWFKALISNHIVDLEALHRLFICRWEKIKNPLQILSEYEHIKRGPSESL